MNEHSNQIVYRVTASLPYPLRLEGGPYKVIGNLGEAGLTFETIRQSTYDTRLNIESGEFDFKVDRNGWASYSRVTSNITPNHSANPLDTLVECLNQVIQNLRDTMSCYWLHELERVDLFRVSIETEGQGTETSSFGRTGGITLPCTGVTADIEERLEHKLASREQVLEWRLLQLDAEDAFNLGKYEVAVLLGWGSLEAACRSETPRLARAANVSPGELQRLLTGEPPKRLPFSFEEVVEKAPIRPLVRVCCDLSRTGYDSGSLAESARNAQKLRNVVTHLGNRLSGHQARRALDAILFVLNVLRLPTSRPPGKFDNKSWVEHFGKVSVDFPKLLNISVGSLVVFRGEHRAPPDPLKYWFQLERADNYYIARIPEDINEGVAAVLVVLANDSSRHGNGQFPHLRVKTPDFLIPGLLDMVAKETTEAVHRAHAGMIRAQEGLEIQNACDYAVDSIWRGFTKLDHTIDPGDARFVPICTCIASYLIHATVESFQRFRQGMATAHQRISDEANEIKSILTKLNPADPHSICDTLRAIHHRTTWLDSIVVQCPIEHDEYGTRKRTL